MITLTPAHKARFSEIRQQLTATGPRESAFTSVELLFFEAIDIARTYGNDVSENNLLAALKQLQSEQYQATKEHYKKSSQREQAIRKFMVQLKRVLNMKEEPSVSHK